MSIQRTAQHSVESTNIADLLERVLDKGIVIAGDIKISLVDIELLSIQLRLVVCSVDKAKEMGMDWWVNNPVFSRKCVQSVLQIQGRINRVVHLGTRLSGFGFIGQKDEFVGACFFAPQFIDPLRIHDPVEPAVQPRSFAELVQPGQCPLACRLDEVIGPVGIPGKGHCEPAQARKQGNQLVAQHLVMDLSIFHRILTLPTT